MVSIPVSIRGYYQLRHRRQQGCLLCHGSRQDVSEPPRPTSQQTDAQGQTHRPTRDSEHHRSKCPSLTKKSSVPWPPSMRERISSRSSDNSMSSTVELRFILASAFFLSLLGRPIPVRHTHACMHTRSLHTHTCTHTHAGSHAGTHARSLACTHARTLACMHACLHGRTPLHMCMRVCHATCDTIRDR